MSDLDRRTILGAAGAGLAVAACSPKSQTEPQKDGVEADSEADARAPYPQYGDDPHSKVTSKFPTNAGLNPEYICAVYIRFDTDGTMIARHGYFDLSKITVDMSEDKIAATLLQAAAAAKNTAEWKVVNYGHSRKEVNFENFSFGHRTRIYILIDNDNVKFDDRKDTQNDAEGVYRNLLRFTKFRVDTGKIQKDGKFQLVPASANHAFFDATLVRLDGFPNRELLRVDNHYTDKNGKPIKADPNVPDSHQLYSINFNLLWTTKDTSGKPPVTRKIPMVIDPDGGNMGSQP